MKVSGISKFLVFAFLGLFTLCNAKSIAQEYLVDFTHYTVEDGLASNFIFGIARDQKGYLWIASRSGLNRFDGREFKLYSKHSHGFESSCINSVAVGGEGSLWLSFFHSSTDLGPNLRPLVFNPITEEFNLFLSYFEEDWNPEWDIPIEFKPADGNVLIITQSGNVVLYENDEFKLVYDHPKGGHNIMHVILMGRSHFYFAAVEQYHTIYKDGISFNLGFRDNYFRRPLGLNLEENVLVYHHDKAGDVVGKLIHETLGENNMRASRLGFADITLVDDWKITMNTHIWDFSQKILWNVTSSNQITAWRPEEGILFSLPIPEDMDLKTIRIEADVSEEGRFWIFSASGLLKIDYQPNRFTHYGSLETNPALGGIASSARGIFLSKRGDLFINSEEGTRVYNIEDNVEKPWVIHRRPVYAFDHTGQHLWFENWERIHRVDLHTLKVDSLERHPAGSAWAFRVLSPNEMIFPVFDGIYLVNPRNQTWRHISDSVLHPKFGKNSFYQTFYDLDKQLWLASTGGLFQLNSDYEIIAHFSMDETGENYIPAKDIHHVHVDEDGIFWLATNGEGLIKWNRVNSSFQTFTRHNGLPTNTLYAILEDELGYLWISTETGLARFRKTDAHFNIFTTKDGISNNEFNRVSYFQAEDGQMFFGGINGVNAFYPSDFDRDLGEYSASLEITSFQKLNGDSELEDLTVQFMSSNQVTMNPGDRFFTLSFQLIDFDNKTGSYAHKLERFETDWTYTDQNTLRFGNLPYGTYTLKVRAQNSRGEWSTNELAVPIVIVAPFYRETWFIVLCVFMFGGLISLLFQQRTRKLRQEQIRLERLIEERTEQINKDKQTIEQQANELQELDAVKSRFFANISHELRTPLTLILGPLQSLKEGNYGDVNERAQHVLGRASRNGKQLLGLIEQILDLSKLETGKLIITLKPINLHDFAVIMHSAFVDLARHRDIDWVLNNQLSTNLISEIDEDKTQKILFNLLNNAFKFTPNGGKIDLTVKMDSAADQVSFSISDTGKGISPEDLPHVFDRFYQSTKQEETLVGGSGIGLAFSKELANALGGSLKVESKVGQGSTFTLSLPLLLAAEENGSANQTTYSYDEVPSEELTPLSRDHTILVVKDNDDMREYVTEVIEQEFKVIAKKDGKEAYDLLQSSASQISLIVSDVMMPRMDGFTLLEKVKQHEYWRRIPMVMLTAKTAIEHKLKALRIGVDDYMAKPFSTEELRVRINNLLGRYEQRTVIEPEEIDEKDQEIAVITYDSEWLKQVEEVVQKEVANTQFNVNTLAASIFLSPKQVTRKLKALTGLTPNKYIREVKMQHARDLIETGRIATLKEVANKAGFERPDYFAKLFMERFGKDVRELL